MPEIDRLSDRPPYRQIADQLRAAIAGGELDPGSKIPSERRLAEDYGVDRATAHRAVLELQAGGLVVAQQGRGVFVRTRPPVRRIARTRLTQRAQRGFYGDLEDHGLQPTVTTEIRRSPAPERIAEFLGVTAGTEVLVRDRHMGAEGEPLQLATTYFAPAVVERVPQLAEADTGPGGMYARMEDAGYQLRQRDYVSSRMPLPEEARALRLGRGVTLTIQNRVTLDQDDRVLEVTEIRMAGDRNELIYDV